MLAVGFIRDDHAAMATIANSGYIKRKVWSNDGAAKEFEGNLNLSLFNQRRFLIPGADLYLKFERAQDTFAIFNNIAALKPNVVIQSMKMELQAVKVNPQVIHQHADALSWGIPALYPIQRVEIENTVCKKDSFGDYKDFLFHGKVPNYIIMVMLSNSAMNGD